MSDRGKKKKGDDKKTENVESETEQQPQGAKSPTGTKEVQDSSVQKTDVKTEKDGNEKAETDKISEKSSKKDGKEKIDAIGAIVTELSKKISQDDSLVPRVSFASDNLDQILQLLKQYSDVTAIVPAASQALEPEDVVKSALVEASHGIKVSTNSLVLLDSLPHFYQLCVSKIGLCGGVGGALDGSQLADTFPFCASMKKHFGTGFDYCYVRIKTANFGFDLEIDPLNMENISCRVGGHEALGIGLTNQSCSPEIKYNDVKSPSEMMRFIVFLVAGAARAGRWIYLAKDEDQKAYLFGEKCWHKAPGVESFRRIHGWLANDDYDNYPHVPEALLEYNPYLWFQREVHDAMTDNGLGTNIEDGGDGPLIDAHFNRKKGEPVMANVDFLSAECHANVLEELYGERMNLLDYINILQMCQLNERDIEGPRVDVILKKYRRSEINIEVEMSWLLTFPNDDIYRQTYHQAFLISPNFRLHVMSVLESAVLSRIAYFHLLPVSCGLAFFERQDNIAVGGTRGLPLVLSEWQNLLVHVTQEGICKRIVYDILAPFSNVCCKLDDLGIPTPSKMLIVLLGAKIALMINPNLYQMNQHVKARLFYDIFHTFFRDEIAELIGEVGYGINIDGHAVYAEDGYQVRRVDSRILQFTLLRNFAAAGDQARPRRWQLMRAIQEWLLRDNVLYVREVGGVRYYPNRRRIRAPGRPFVPQQQLGGGVLPAYGQLVRALDFTIQYQQLMFGPEKNLHTPNERLALDVMSSAIRPFIQSFAEWFHWVYCPIYLEIALHPMIWWNHQNDVAEWRNFHCVREEPDLLEQHQLHGAPFTRPVPAFYNSRDMAPFSIREGIDLLTRVYTPGNMYKGGECDGDAVIEMNYYHNLWQSNDSEQMVEAFVRAMYGGRELMEGLKLICDMTLGQVFENVAVHEYIRAAFMSRRLPNRVYYEILDLFGIRIDDKALAKTGAGFMEEKLNGDYRVYFPQTGIYDARAGFRADGWVVRDPVRRSLRLNVRLLLDAVFHERYGMIKFRTGMTLSLLPRNDLLFTSTHTLFQFYCQVSPDVILEYQGDMDRQVRYFTVLVAWTNAAGQNLHVRLKVKTIHDMLEALRPLVRGTVDGVTFIVNDTRRVNPNVIQFIKEAVEQHLAVVMFPNTKGILHHTITSVMNVTAMFRQYEMETFSMLQGMAPTSMIRMNIVETTHVRGGVFETNVVKPLLPLDPGADDWVFCTDVNTVDRRVRGIPIRIGEFFPTIVFREGRRPWVMVDNERRAGYPRFPFGLRSLIFVLHYNPLFRPEIVTILE
uniref:VP2 n=1 Tax=Tarumizu tick virus TaxID=2014339 RepID=A0A292G322_9REOV|nr:VP2 [Tarumizu tick virus]